MNILKLEGNFCPDITTQHLNANLIPELLIGNSVYYIIAYMKNAQKNICSLDLVEKKDFINRNK